MKKLTQLFCYFTCILFVTFIVGLAVVPAVMADSGGPEATVVTFGRTSGDMQTIHTDGYFKLSDNAFLQNLVNFDSAQQGWASIRLDFDADIYDTNLMSDDGIAAPFSANEVVMDVKGASDDTSIGNHGVTFSVYRISGEDDLSRFYLDVSVPSPLFDLLPIKIDFSIPENTVYNRNGVGNVEWSYTFTVVKLYPFEMNLLELSDGEPTGNEIAPNGFAIVAHIGTIANSMVTSALPVLDNVPLVMADNMPNLEDFLYNGGTIDVFVEETTNGLPDIIINEVMWAVDEDKVGTVEYTKQQWIELYNNSSSFVALDDITLRFTPLSPAPNVDDLQDGKMWTDRLSNVMKYSEPSGATVGWILGSNYGQNGNSNEANLKEFISMYRRSDRLGNYGGVFDDSWLRSTVLSHRNHRATPGAANTRSGHQVIHYPTPSAFEPKKDKVIINEVYNAANDDYDWIELLALQDTNIEDWTLSYSRSNFEEVEILRFPEYTMKAGEVWLFVNKDPVETDLAAGQDIELSAGEQVFGAGDQKYLIMTGDNRVEIPDYKGGEFHLILRTAEGWERFGSQDRMHDVAGPARFARQTLNTTNVIYEPHTGDPGEIWETDIWPLNGHSTDEPDKVYLQSDHKFSVGSVWARNGTKHGWVKDGGLIVGFMGGIGYDRNPTGHGTPGYYNHIVQGASSDIRDGHIIISELMLTQGNRGYPQWIEIRNTSKTTGVDLHFDTDDSGIRQGWSLVIENHNSGLWDERNLPLNVEINFQDLGIRYIPPNQTILIVSHKGRNSGAFPDHRVASIWDSTVARSAFGMEVRKNPFLNAEGGFLIQLVDGSGDVTDEVGNLDGKSANARGDIRFDDPFSWNWPTDLTEENYRTSLIRLKHRDGSPRVGTPNRAVDGDLTGAVLRLGARGRPVGYAWVHAVDTAFYQVQETWYGNSNDVSTPGYIRGTPLPVSLSFFRPTLENGEVIIRWTTESEIDNAGFNILRSKKRHGEYIQVNSQLIQGAGTTGERNNYKWVDTTTKPGIAYYYEIEDVSFTGEHQVLATARLKGLMSAKNKLTTTWSELKSSH